MVLDLSGHELTEGIVVMFWSPGSESRATGYVEAVSVNEPNRIRVRALAPEGSRGLSFEVWAADCETKRGPHGRPLQFLGRSNPVDDLILEEPHVQEVEGREAGGPEAPGGGADR